MLFEMDPFRFLPGDPPYFDGAGRGIAGIGIGQQVHIRSHFPYP